ncbi:MAG: hypothetical protein Q9220_003194 [cf. Caloplaca sp. 1 TL-2023]
MKILTSQSAPLTNHEVLLHLRSLPAARTSSSTASKNTSTVVREVISYLTPPSATSADPTANPSAAADTTTNTTSAPTAEASTTVQTSQQNPIPQPLEPEQIKQLIHNLAPYALEKSEVLTLANLLPKELWLLDCVVEECDARFSEGEQVGILRAVERVCNGKED